MKPIFNGKGLTLIEILAAVVILSIVMVLATSIFVTSQQENIRQTESIRQLKDESYAFKVITKDIRRASEVNAVSNGLELTIKGSEVKYIIEASDEKNEFQLLKIEGSQQQAIATNVGCFLTKEDDGKVKLALSTNPSVTNCEIDSKDVQQTIIQLRKGE